jgi:hypothetical protein
MINIHIHSFQLNYLICQYLIKMNIQHIEKLTSKEILQQMIHYNYKIFYLYQHKHNNNHYLHYSILNLNNLIQMKYTIKIFNKLLMINLMKDYILREDHFLLFHGEC